MSMRRVCIIVAALATLGACSDTATPVAPLPPTIPPPGPPPIPAPVLTGQWRAQQVGGVALPAAVARFTDDPAVPGVTELRLDDAVTTLSDDGRYTRVTLYSEWNTLTPNDPSSWRVRFRYRDSDFGSYTRSGSTVLLTSGWIQNLVVRGSLADGGALRLQHGLTPGDDLLDIRYQRQP
jgi:hypothetical protein